MVVVVGVEVRRMVLPAEAVELRHAYEWWWLMMMECRGEAAGRMGRVDEGCERWSDLRELRPQQRRNNKGGNGGTTGGERLGEGTERETGGDKRSEEY